MEKNSSNAKVGCLGCLGLFVIIMLIAGICAVIPGGDDSDPDDSDPIESRWEKCFDAWDGNHIEFERLVKNQLKAPSTFKHVETRYSTGEFPRLLTMTYEAENSFGVPLRSTATGQSDIECNVTALLYE